MKYLPILQELFESDSYIFMLMGLVATVLIGVIAGKPKNKIYGVLGSMGAYVVCEIFMNIRTNFMMELVLLFIGTIAIGGIIGFLIAFVITKINFRKLNEVVRILTTSALHD